MSMKHIWPCEESDSFVPVVFSISNLALIVNGMGTTPLGGGPPADDDGLENLEAELRSRPGA